MIYSHTGDIGDIIYSLSVAQFTGCDHYIICQTRGPQRNMIDENLYKFIAPLLERQSYINNVIFHKDSYQTEMNNFRYWLRWFSIPEAHFYAYKYSKEQALNHIRRYNWIECDKKPVKKILISKTGRYWNHDLNFDIIKDYKRESLGFIGTEREYHDFTDQYKIQSDYIKVSSLLEMAEVIKGSEMMVCNPSSPCAISQCMGHPTVVLCHPGNVAQINLEKENALIVSNQLDEYRKWMFFNKYSISLK